MWCFSEGLAKTQGMMITDEFDMTTGVRETRTRRGRLKREVRNEIVAHMTGPAAVCEGLVEHTQMEVEKSSID